MTYLTCPGDINFPPVPGIKSTGTVVPVEKRCAIGMYLHVHICYVQTLLVHDNVRYFWNKLT